MSRELLGLFVVGVLCIMISPLFKELNVREYPPSIVSRTLYKKETIQTTNPKSIVFLSDSFLPITFAGSEITGYETLKYLRKRGHNISIFVKNYKVHEYDGFRIYKYNTRDKFCTSTIMNADCVFFQMGGEVSNFDLVKQRDKPVYVFIHLVNSYNWLLQQRVSFPIKVVYNSHMTQDTLPTLHDNMRMIPYVDINKFKVLREYTVQNSVVCLINCSKNKGGELLRTLAHSMRNVQFIGVKGGYADQVIDENPPDNLTYMENQKDISVVFKKIGVLIMPSGHETWGRTAVEAMASGVVVIHSEAAGLVECVGGAGIMCAREDEDAWADAIRKLNGDRAYKERFRQYGFKRVEEIDVEQRRGREELAMKIEDD